MLHISNLLSELTQQSLLIERGYGNGILIAVAAALGSNVSAEVIASTVKQITAENAEKNAPFILSPEGNSFSKSGDSSNIKENSIAVFVLDGPVMRTSQIGVPGTDDLRQQIGEALKHENIIGSILVINTGGGAVDGTFQLSDMLAQSSKPIVAFTTSRCCSAGYALASAAKGGVFAEHRTNVIGSVGTCSSFMDVDGFFEQKLGMKPHYVNADKSEHKNKAYTDAQKGDYTFLKAETLNPFNEIFHAHVKEMRPGISEEIFKGGVFLSQQAIDLKLIDGIASFEEVVNYTHELAIKSKSDVR